MHEEYFRDELILLAQKIKQERERLGLTQEEFSLHCGLSIYQLSNIEMGRSIPSAFDLIKICRFANKNVDDFLNHFPSYESRLDDLLKEAKKLDKFRNSGIVGVDPIKLDLRTKKILLEAIGVIKKSKKGRRKIVAKS